VQGYLYGRAQTAADVAEMVRPLTRPRLRSA
jgi:hypothetical protein